MANLAFEPAIAGNISIAETYNGSQGMLTVPVWYALPVALFTETDTIAFAATFDSRCSVPARFGQTSSVVTQSITSVDAVFGNLETQTTTAYNVGGVGTVCSIFTDSTQTFYDYTGQENYVIYTHSATTPILTTNTTEVLSITAGTVSGQPISTESAQRFHSRSAIWRSS